MSDILSVDRVSVAGEAEGVVRTKEQALERLGAMLATGAGSVARDEIVRVLRVREELQSTGVGGGVAVPHASVDLLQEQIGALLVCPEPIEFGAIDGAPVNLLFALVGPKNAPAKHLRILARVSRLFKEATFCEALLAARSGAEAYELICRTEQRGD